RWLSVPPSFTYPTTRVSRFSDPQSSHVAFADPTPPPRPIQKPCRSWGCDAADATEAKAKDATADNAQTTIARPRIDPPLDLLRSGPGRRIASVMPGRSRKACRYKMRRRMTLAAESRPAPRPTGVQELRRALSEWACP